MQTLTQLGGYVFATPLVVLALISIAGSAAMIKIGLKEASFDDLVLGIVLLFLATMFSGGALHLIGYPLFN